MGTRPNVLMISVDELGRNHMEIGGDTVSRMPTLRFLAEHGQQFDNCYSECPVCIPARRSLMTGLTPRTHGDRIYNDTLRMPEVTTLAQAFRNGGYQAYCVGKLHVYPQRDRIGFDDAQIIEEGRYEFGETDDYQRWLGEQGFVGQEFMHGMGNNIYYTHPWHLPDYTHPTNWTTQKMCETIKRRDPTRPAFYYVSYQFPHPPLVPLSSYMDEFRNEKLPDPLCGDWVTDEGIIGEMIEKSAEYTEKEKAEARKAYYAQCQHIDHQIRILIGTLRECQMLDNTLIVFLSDHGDMLFDHKLVAKRSFYEASGNIPMILSGPVIAAKAGQTDHRLCCLADVMPTLLELCGLPVPESVEGISMESETKRQYLYGEVGEGRKATRMLRDADYKLIYYPNGNVSQLFDMHTDRAELKDLAKLPEYRDVLSRMEQELIRHLYGEDLKWVKDHKLVGQDFGTPPQKADYGLYNQRGYHWSSPRGYSNIGKNA